jgi:S1-C subfamily serine protease
LRLRLGIVLSSSAVRVSAAVATLVLLLVCLPLRAAGDDWSAMLERISSGVVSLDIDVPLAFDTDPSLSSQATGFVVDAEQGLILTNRHVVTAGPVRAEALFLNREEVPLVPVYRDPVHDFGFFRFDPEALKYLRPAELRLAPERAVVGREVRIVGNDAGEQLSILSGTIARLDRSTPFYGYGKYNDFNTFYIQAASGSSGGSSGSPVLDSSGVVVALNAGASSNAASSFFLPLHRVQRALQLIRDGKPVTRGTLQARYVQVTYDELRRLGLGSETEGIYRQCFPDSPGLLAVAHVLPGGVADGVLRVGDILLSVNGEAMVDFVTLEAVLDDQVGGQVTIGIERSGERLERRLSIADLHAITPDEYLKFGNAVVHELSYQQGWHVNKPLQGVYVAAPGYVLSRAGLPSHSIIVGLDGKLVSSLDEFEQALSVLADGQRTAVRFYTLDEPSNVQQRILRMDRRWFPAQRCKLDDQGGWPCRELGAGPEALKNPPAFASYPEQSDKTLQAISRSLVLVNFDMPYSFSGVSEQHYFGTGLVVDAERGLVVVDRNTVPEAMGDVRLTFAASVEINGRVEFIHPFHNLAVLSYDPADLGDTPVSAAALKVTAHEPGDELRAVGIRPDGSLASQSVAVASVGPIGYPLSGTLRFRETNLEAISLVTPPQGVDGVLIDKRARVVALWSSFAFDYNNELREDSRGVPADLVLETLDMARASNPVRSLEVELETLPTAIARNFGLSEEWLEQLQRHDPKRRQVLSVERTVAGTPASRLMRTGDLLLAVNGKTVNRFREVEQAFYGQDAIDLTLWRDGRALEIEVPTESLAGTGVRRLLYWGGSLLQEPYRDVAAQRGHAPEGVYVAFISYGSPATRAGLSAGGSVVEVDGAAVANLDEFIAAVAGKTDGDSVRLTVRKWNAAVEVITLKLDQVFWPSWEIVHNGDWRRVPMGQLIH